MFSQKVIENLGKSSWIRAMFEEGDKLRRIYGSDRVFDFSLGNPDVEPPQGVKEALKEFVTDDKPGMHGYMSNAGYTDVRSAVAAKLQSESGISLTGDNIVMTCGAGGGLNIVLKSLINPGDEVIVIPPYFVEYNFYIDNYGGKTVEVPSDFNTFEPDPAAIERSITPRTKGIIINTPNNPTGVVYSEKTLKKLSGILEKKQSEYGTEIFVISDQPYAKIAYDGVKVPEMLSIFKNCIIVDSYSKSLSLPGERIGYIAASSRIKDVDVLVNALIFCNRTLGFVNAPALFQKVIGKALNEAVNVEAYKARRDLMYNHLVKLGFRCIKPKGAFYLFPKALIEDDLEFTKRALKHNLILVPGRGFGCPGYFRISYCVGLSTIKNSFQAFEALAREFK